MAATAEFNFSGHICEALNEDELAHVASNLHADRAESLVIYGRQKPTFKYVRIGVNHSVSFSDVPALRQLGQEIQKYFKKRKLRFLRLRSAW